MSRRIGPTGTGPSSPDRRGPKFTAKEKLPLNLAQMVQRVLEAICLQFALERTWPQRHSVCGTQSESHMRSRPCELVRRRCTVCGLA